MSIPLSSWQAGSALSSGSSLPQSVSMSEMDGCASPGPTNDASTSIVGAMWWRSIKLVRSAVKNCNDKNQTELNTRQIMPDYTPPTITKSPKIQSHWVQEVTLACRTLKWKQVTGCKKWHELVVHWNASHWVQEVALACCTLKCTCVYITRLPVDTWLGIRGRALSS